MAPIRITDIVAYKDTFEETAALFKSLGAIEVSEFYSDGHDENHNVSIPQALKCATDEIVVFGWAVWPSREALDLCNDQLQNNPRAIKSNTNFDIKRMIVGKFLPAS